MEMLYEGHSALQKKTGAPSKERVLYTIKSGCLHDVCASTVLLPQFGVPFYTVLIG